MLEYSQLRAGKLQPMRMNALAQLSSPLVLTPAMGRKYAKVEDMLADWESGKDFKMYGSGAYCSIRDLAALAEQASTVSLMQPSPLLTIRIV